MERIFANDWRLYSADAEDLAEGGVGAFIEVIRPFLVSEGVQMSQVTDQIDERYVVLVNGVPVIEDAKMTGKLPGKVLRGAGYSSR